MEKETKKELGKVQIDIAKYIITAVVVSSFFKSFNDTWAIYVLGSLTACMLFVLGFWFFNNSNKK